MSQPVHKHRRSIYPTLILLLASTSAVALDLPARHHISIVGSSTLYPILSAAAEHFSRSGEYRTPVLESTGTGGGFKLFCSGLGMDTPDVVMASRPMKPGEWERCRSHGITELKTIKLGYGGVALVNARGGPEFALSTRDLYLALARRVPDPTGKPRLVPNPYRRWRQIHPTLPDTRIRVLGPPPTSGTHDILVERVMQRTCDQIDFLRQTLLRSNTNKTDCYALREDGPYENAGENDSRLVRRLMNDPEAVGVLGFNFLDRNREKLRAASIDGIQPELEKISTGLYPLSRPLLLYVKRIRIGAVPGLSEFIDHVTDPQTRGYDGYLVDEGLIPLPAPAEPQP